MLESDTLSRHQRISNCRPAETRAERASPK
jgi:hypothetical protein